MDIKRIIGLVAAISLVSGGVFAGTDSSAEKKQQQVKTEESHCDPNQQGKLSSQCGIPQARKAQVAGITLVNPDNPEEAVLVVQVNVPGGEDGKVVPQLIQIPLKMDTIGKKLVDEYGITATKAGDTEGAKSVQEQATEKFVIVNGTVSFENNAPVITVQEYESGKHLIAKATVTEVQNPEAQ